MKPAETKAIISIFTLARNQYGQFFQFMMCLSVCRQYQLSSQHGQGAFKSLYSLFLLCHNFRYYTPFQIRKAVLYYPRKLIGCNFFDNMVKARSRVCILFSCCATILDTTLLFKSEKPSCTIRASLSVVTFLTPLAFMQVVYQI